MKLSILIVNYNSGALTHSCLESLLKHGLPKAHEIIVVDNASRDDSVAWLRSDWPEITVIANPTNLGLAAAVNQGLAIARGEYVLLLNPDIIAFPGAVEKLIAFMDTHPRAGMAGGKLRSPNGKLQHSAFRFYRPSTIVYRRTWLGSTKRGQAEIDRFLMKDFDHEHVRPVEWLMGSCYILRAAAEREVGGMDERFFLYFEDVDWCRRFWEKGWQVLYVPDAEFSHFHQRQSRSHPFGIITNWTTREHIRSAIKYFMKYRGQPTPVVDQPTAL
jgi:N-acetylglucosaminyl-diphospho-decaprenol L-rhamnosyltransferase